MVKDQLWDNIQEMEKAFLSELPSIEDIRAFADALGLKIAKDGSYHHLKPRVERYAEAHGEEEFRRRVALMMDDYDYAPGKDPVVPLISLPFGGTGFRLEAGYTILRSRKGAGGTRIIDEIAINKISLVKIVPEEGDRNGKTG